MKTKLFFIVTALVLSINISKAQPPQRQPGMETVHQNNMALPVYRQQGEPDHQDERGVF